MHCDNVAHEIESGYGADIMPRPDFSLPKAMKLRHRTLVNALFSSGKTIYAPPLKLVWRRFSTESLNEAFRSTPPHIAPVQFMITIPKKKQRRAVDRVLLRRRVREAYRLSRLRTETLQSCIGDDNISLAFIYLSTKQHSYARIEESVRQALNKLFVTLADYKENTINNE